MPLWEIKVRCLRFSLSRPLHTSIDLEVFHGFLHSLCHDDRHCRCISSARSTVSDQVWQKAMIPHHSIAILTSSRASIQDVRVRALADDIIKAQRREIKEMEWLINDIDSNGKATTQEAAQARPVPKLAGS